MSSGEPEAGQEQAEEEREQDDDGDTFVRSIEGRLVRREWADGEIWHYEGEKGQERHVRSEQADGEIWHYEGEKGQERFVRSEQADGEIWHYEGEKGQERLVRIEFADGHPLYGKIICYEGEKGQERKVRVVFARHHQRHGQIQEYEGEKDQERIVRVEFATGKIQHYEGEKGKERKRGRPESSAQNGGQSTRVSRQRRPLPLASSPASTGSSSIEAGTSAAHALAAPAFAALAAVSSQSVASGSTALVPSQEPHSRYQKIKSAIKRSPMPWQASVIEVVEKTPVSTREVQWIYSKEGNLGKSWTAEYLVCEYDAVLIHSRKVDEALSMVKDVQSSEKPVVLFDLTRAESNTIPPSLYRMLEKILSVPWEATPHIFVFANAAPDCDKLTADRFQVKLIHHEKKCLVAPTHIERKLEAYQKRVHAEQLAEEAAAVSGVQPEGVDRTIFERCYTIKEGAKKIKSSDMLIVLNAAGCDFKNVKELGPWIKEEFKAELAARKVAGCLKHGAAAWKGFEPVASEPAASSS